MSNNAYSASPRAVGNFVPVSQESSSDGFSAVAYFDSTSNQLVIAFMGTDPSNMGTLQADFDIAKGR
jgi:hypothetical protein